MVNDAVLTSYLDSVPRLSLCSYPTPLQPMARLSAALGGPEVYDSHYSAGAYGLADDAVVEAIRMGARLEALQFDPVYSGKGLAGLIGLIRADHFPPDARVLFLHTGGDPALFAHRSLFSE